MMILLLILLAVPSFADGPQFVNPSDQKVYSEFQNAYNDIRRLTKISNQSYKIYNVQCSSTTTATSTTSTSYVDTDLNVGIRPKSTSNKIVVWSVNQLLDAVAPYTATITHFRGSTQLAAVQEMSSATTAFRLSVTLLDLDSPSSTSFLTYRVKLKNRNGSGNTVTHNDDPTFESTICVMEVGS